MSRDIFLVIGGSGFVGRHIVQQLLDRGDVVHVFDIVQRYHDVPFYSGDISDQDSVFSALQNSGATCIFHTASPPIGVPNAALYWKVNVDGTRAVIAAAQLAGVRKLVFTSSAGVVFNGGDLIDTDERLPTPEKPLDAYNESKAKGEEAVLAANGQKGLLTVALRPAGIFGPGDRQVMSGLYQVYSRNQTHFQIGDNTNLFDWTYVGNVAHAHLLAADKLDSPPPHPPSQKLDSDDLNVSLPRQIAPEEYALVSTPLPPINLTTGSHPIPTCEARPLGPYITLLPNAQKIEEAFHAACSHPSPNRPVIRSRFDPLSADALSRQVKSPLQIAGQAFFITNGEPMYFWDFPRAVWNLLDTYLSKSSPTPRKSRRLIILPKSIGLLAATGAEWFAWLMGTEPTFTRYKVTYSCATRWHNIEKARRVLGYEPEVGIEEGVKRMVDWWVKEGKGTGKH